MSTSARDSARLPWLAVYPGEWLRDTRGWSLTTRAAYFELLLAQWDKGSLPIEPEELRAIVRASRAEWRSTWPILKGHFPRCGGGRRNPTLQARRDEQQHSYERRREAGLRGNAARWGSPGGGSV